MNLAAVQLGTVQLFDDVLNVIVARELDHTLVPTKIKKMFISFVVSNKKIKKIKNK